MSLSKHPICGTYHGHLFRYEYTEACDRCGAPRRRRAPRANMGGPQGPVTATEVSTGRKLAGASATYAAQATCPSSCPFLGAGCYAENGFVGGFITKPLNRHAEGLTPLELARLEAEAIDRLTGARDLRLHVVGDSATVEGTLLLAEAAGRYVARGEAATGRRPSVWTYTHAWREVPRSAWGSVAVLASCESAADVIEAQGRGYATELTVDRHHGDRLQEIGPLRVLPCPEQTRGVRCADCRLCFDDARLLERGITIGFALHGQRHVAGRSLSAARRRSFDEHRPDGPGARAEVVA